MSNSTPISGDWVVSKRSNCHVTCNQYWFSEYAIFPSEVTNIAGDIVIKVEGVGTVKIPVRITKLNDGKRYTTHQVLVIRDVLYAPHCWFNILSADMLAHNTDPWHQGQLPTGSIGLLGLSDELIAEFDPTKTSDCLRVSGPPKGPFTIPSLFKKALRDRKTHFTANLSDEERKKIMTRPLGASEKAFIDTKWDGDVDFMCEYGWDINNEDDRDKAKKFARRLMCNSCLSSED